MTFRAMTRNVIQQIQSSLALPKAEKKVFYWI